MYNGFSQPGSPYGNSLHGLPSYHAQSIVGSVGQPAVFQNNNPNFSTASSFEYNQPGMMMMMPASQQQMMYQPVQMQSSIPQNYMYPGAQLGMQFRYHPMMQHAQMIPSGMQMPMMTTGNRFPTQTYGFPSPSPFYHPMAQQLVY